MRIHPPKPRSALAATAAALWLLFPFRAWPQTGDLRFVHITRNDGLSKNSLLGILQDRQGFMWFVTESGLNKFDGNGFIVYRHVPGDPSSLSQNYLLTATEDREGIFWIGTFSGGLNRFDPSRGGFRCFRHVPGRPDTLSDDTVGVIHEGRDGALWLGTDNGLNRFDRRSGRFAYFPLDGARIGREDQIHDIHEDRDGILWIATYGNGLYRFERETGKFSRFANGPPAAPTSSRDFMNCLHEDDEGWLWIGSDGGLYRFDRRSGRFERPAATAEARQLLDGQINALAADRSGRLWVGATNGLAILDARSGETRVHRHNPLDAESLSSDWITAIFQDRSGIMWLGTEEKGINRCNPDQKKFRHHRALPGQDNGLSHNVVFSFWEDAARTLWIGTQAGLDRFDRLKNTVSHLRALPGDPDGFRGGAVRCILPDRAQNLWLGTDGGGLKFFDRGKGRTTVYRNAPGNGRSLSHDRVRVLRQDRYGTLWIGTLGGGLNRLERGAATFSQYRFREEDPASLSNDVVRAILEDREGTLWVGTQAGLNRFVRETGKFVRYRHDPADPGSLGNECIFNLHEDRQGNIWIATWGGGLDRLERGKERFSHFTTADGLASNEIYGILEDPAENLWLMTNEGVSRFSPRLRQFRNYDVSDGLQSKEFLSGSFYQSANGEMFFGGVNGFNAFHPQDIFDSGYVPPVHITSFKVLNREVRLPRAIWETKEIELSAKDSLFSFEFAALDYSAPEKNRYAYRLDGLTEDWVLTDAAHRQASFSRLPPGRYVFRVRGSNSDGLWSEPEAALVIRVRPPWWRSGWFLSLLAAAVALLTFEWNRTRIRRRAAKVRSAEAMEQLFDQCTISPREREITLLLLKGLNNKEISEKLYIELSTVKIHVHHILRKLGVRNRTELLLLFQNLRRP